MCQITCLFEKRPELFQEMSGTMFFKARFKIFFGISKKKKLLAISVTLKMTIKKYFFVEKNLVKKTPIKFVEIFCQNKRASG